MSEAGGPAGDTRWATLGGQAREAMEQHAEALRQLHAVTRELHQLTRHGRPTEAIADAKRRLGVATAVERLAHQQVVELAGVDPNPDPPGSRAASPPASLASAEDDVTLEPPPDDEDHDARPAPTADDVLRHARRRAMVAAAVVGAFGGLGSVTVAAADAGPGSPLWPITKVVYTEAAQERQAKVDAMVALTKARTALADGRLHDAAQHLDRAARWANEVDPATAVELRKAVDQLRGQLQERQNGDDQQGTTDQPAGGEPADESPAPTPSPSPEPE
ncbi:MAG: hypothetical protein GEU94_20655, partial [Micromonosporaceae bacterium]|nr:hypothetical protein [Micromonosporaceae bacterium]